MYTSTGIPFSLWPFSPSILLSSSLFYLTSLVLVLLSSHKADQATISNMCPEYFPVDEMSRLIQRVALQHAHVTYISHMYYALINIPRPRNNKYNGLETHDQDTNGLDLERERGGAAH